MKSEISFADVFEKATENRPYDYQTRLATGDDLPELVDIPTGLGKTAAVILAWIWRRRFASESVRRRTPRRLVYCLPMRTLVEQTRDCAVEWINKLAWFAGTFEHVGDSSNGITSYTTRTDEQTNGIAVYVLMGGESPSGDWSAHPERDAILIGTQDMLLSRALNRGYGARRSRWPIDFGLLHSDCLWVVDEVQLMGCGLATTAQIDAFAKKLWMPAEPTRFVWMSATTEDSFLQTRDRRDWQLTAASRFELSKGDRETPAIKARLQAPKALSIIKARPTGSAIIEAHVEGRLSLLIVNTVPVAKSLYTQICQELTKPAAKNKPQCPQPKVCLLHSRFRPMDRELQLARLRAFCKKMDKSGAVPESDGLIVVSTQVVEAGFDLSSIRLWSEIAPWPSVIQRLGRLNREGSQAGAFAMFWRPGADENSKGETNPNAKRIGPYEKAALNVSEDLLKDVIGRQASGLDYRSALDAVLATDESRTTLIVEPEVVIRPGDFFELFSTEPDLAGGFTNVSQFVRDQDRNADVYIFWRDFNPAKMKPVEELAPERDELCSVPFFEFRQFVGKSRIAWEWNFETRRWESRRANEIQPGMTLLLPRSAGGYCKNTGWTGDAKDNDFDVLPNSGDQDSLDADFLSGEKDWVSLSDHLADVEAEMNEILHALDLRDASIGNALLAAARWHDWGKSAGKWQEAVKRYVTQACAVLEKLTQESSIPGFFRVASEWRERLQSKDGSAGPWAKFPDIRAACHDERLELADCERDELRPKLKVSFLPNLRHEAASALAAWEAWLENRDDLTALAVYLIACHHGKVRTVLRSSSRRGGDDVFGVTDGTTLQPVRKFFQDPAHICTDAKYVGACGAWDDTDTSFTLLSPSWLQMIDELLGPKGSGEPMASEVIAESEPRNLGPLKVAYFEALLRAADVRASRMPGKGGRS